MFVYIYFFSYICTKRKFMYIYPLHEKYIWIFHVDLSIHITSQSTECCLTWKPVGIYFPDRILNRLCTLRLPWVVVFQQWLFWLQSDVLEIVNFYCQLWQDVVKAYPGKLSREGKTHPKHGVTILCEEGPYQIERRKEKLWWVPEFSSSIFRSFWCEQAVSHSHCQSHETLLFPRFSCHDGTVLRNKLK